MNQDVSGHSDQITMPASAADAWAAVYIDVAEKLDAEDHQHRAGDAACHTTGGDLPPAEASPARENARPAT
jgi:hypothetical protein